MLLIYEFIGFLLDRLTEIHNDLDGHLVYENQFMSVNHLWVVSFHGKGVEFVRPDKGAVTTA